MKKIFLSLLLSGTAVLVGNDIHTISKLNGVLSQEDLNYFSQEFGVSSFIETGTYAGDTTNVASTVFNQVYSADIYEPIYKQAQKRFVHHENVHLYLGDSCFVLEQMIKDSSSKRLYWLDAHSSGGGTGGIPGFSPILYELKQIFENENDDFVILIDDLRGMCHCDERTNLPMREIITCIKEFNPDLEFYSIGDIGIVYNPNNYPDLVVSDIVKAASQSRFFDPSIEDEEVLNQLLDAELFISKIGKNSCEEKNLRKLPGFVNRNELGGEVIYLLWEALFAMGENDYKSAAADLKLISKSFYSHWRIDAYLAKALLLNDQIEEAHTLITDKLLEAQMKHPKILEKILGDTYGILISRNEFSSK